MATLYLELYQQTIPDQLSNLPGAQFYQPGPGIYWAVLTASPVTGSPADFLFQPAEIPGFPNSSTHGTDTLSVDSENFVLTSFCIWHPKQPPYLFRITLPDGSEQTLNPLSDSDDEHAWFCEAVQSSASPMGIYTIEVSTVNTPQLPQQIGNLAANLNLDLLPFSSDFFEKQPLLKINGFDQDIVPLCPEIEKVEIKGCVPGEVEFLISFDQGEGIDQLIWTLGDGVIVTIELGLSAGSVIIESLGVDGTDNIDESNIEITDAAAFTIKLNYEYLEQPNLPPDYIYGSVTVVRVSCGNPTAIGTLQIPICDGTSLPPCPNISGPVIDVSDSCIDGEKLVSFSATIESDYYGGSFRLVNLDTNQPVENSELIIEAQISTGDNLVLSGETNLAPGSYRLFCENSCSSSSLDFLVDCPVCPDINFLLVSSGRDCVDGLRPNNFSVEVRTSSKNYVEACLIDEASGEELASGSSSNGYLVFAGSKNYPEGSHSVRVVIKEPANCRYEDDSDRLDFYVAGCPQQNCPDIVIGELETSVSADCNNGQRTVRVSSNVSVPDNFNGAIEASLSDEVGVLESQTGVTQSFNLSAEKEMAPGSHTLSIVVTTDEGCRYSASREVNPAPCETPPWRPPNWIPPVPDWLCMLWLVFNFFLLVVTAVAIGVAACFWSVVPVLIVASIIAVVAGILSIISFILWILLCGWKPNVCPFARWLPRIITIMGFIFGVIVLVIAIIELIVLLVASSQVGGGGALASLPCFIGAFIEFAYFGLLAFIIWEILLIVGCPPLPLIRLPRLPDVPE